LPATMRSGRMPSLIHTTASRDNRRRPPWQRAARCPSGSPAASHARERPPQRSAALGPHRAEPRPRSATNSGCRHLLRVSGSHRCLSLVRNHPLKSVHQTS
jgi:hypothetical protein